MPWLKIDDGFPEHERVLGLSDRAFRVHMTGLCQCAKNLTDGLVDHRRLTIIRAIVDKPVGGAVNELVKVELWIEVEDGHMIRDYLDYNPTAAAVKLDRAKATVRQAKWRASHRRNGVTNALADDVTNASGETVPRPVPSRKELSKGFSHLAAGTAPGIDIPELREIA